ncbi:exodeoxyribonuclease VII small subunit [Patescibacteria group bacterium]|nr:exodeoxyribonuclease VII small subunit [Patescibacteria group bacterium]MBU4368055.1 exodeoxyribonuclease VII small subunit [Patescibacteria group bacterium]MBU4462226.1 exodeoxyribonuclease VII small subunit [Patescibacteria group bacterium]MCG2699582.1 hypothetical protein [Candidatus Parcubacteria bacterium]
MTKEKPDIKNLSDNLKKLSDIADWFDNREDADIEQGLEKVKEAVVLIKASKERLKEIENEFEEIKKEIDIDGEKEEDNSKQDV